MTSSNTLHGVEGTWITDGNPNCVLSVDPTSRAPHPFVVVECHKSSGGGGSPVNVIFQPNDKEHSSSSFTSDSLFWQATILEASSMPSVGLVSSSQFQPGYKIRGLFYNGNLTNGTAALQTAFGDYLKQGDKVGVLLHQGTHTPVDWRPCLSLKGSTTKILWEFPPTLPTERERPRPALRHPVFLGQWKLVKATWDHDNETLTLPEQRVIQLDITEHTTGVDYRLSLHVANRLGTMFRVQGKTLDNDDHHHHGAFVVQCQDPAPMVSTRMMPPPELQVLETTLSQCIPMATRLTCTDDDDNMLLTLSNESKEFQLDFTRYVKTFALLTKYM